VVQRAGTVGEKPQGHRHALGVDRAIPKALGELQQIFSTCPDLATSQEWLY